MRIENFGKRDRIRLHTVLGVRYETTPDQMRYILVELKKMLHSHPKIDRDPVRVRFIDFGAFSLNIEVMCYAITQNQGEFLAIKEDIYLLILELVNNSGTGFAFPSQTIYMEKGEGVNSEQTKSVEKQVTKWRKDKKLYMPDITEEQIDKIDNLIPYLSLIHI